MTKQQGQTGRRGAGGRFSRGSAALWDPGLEVYFSEMGEGKTQPLWIPSSAVSRICDACGTQLPGAWSWALLTTTLWAWSDRWHHFKDTETQIQNREMVSTRQRAPSGEAKESHFSCFIFPASITSAREVHRALVSFTLASSLALWRFCTQLACQTLDLIEPTGSPTGECSLSGDGYGEGIGDLHLSCGI